MLGAFFLVFLFMILEVMYLFNRHFRVEKIECPDCVSTDISSYVGFRDGAWIGEEAEAYMCNKCGTTFLTNEEYNDNLFLLKDRDYLYNIFCAKFEEYLDEYEGPAKKALLAHMIVLQSPESVGDAYSFVEDIADTAKRYPEAGVMPMERFDHLCDCIIRDIAKNLEWDVAFRDKQ